MSKDRKIHLFSVRKRKQSIQIGLRWTTVLITQGMHYSRLNREGHLLECNLTTFRFRWPSAIKTFTRAAAASRRTFEASQTKFEASEKSARASLKKAELSEKLSVEAMRKSELQSEMCFVLRSKCFRR